jgi:hypothetical protein
MNISNSCHDSGIGYHGMERNDNANHVGWMSRDSLSVQGWRVRHFSPRR